MSELWFLCLCCYWPLLNKYYISFKVLDFVHKIREYQKETIIWLVWNRHAIRGPVIWVQGLVKEAVCTTEEIVCNTLVSNEQESVAISKEEVNLFSCGVGLQPDYKFIWTWRSDKFGGSKGEINQTTPPSLRSAQTTGKNLWEEPPEICLKKKHELVNFLNRNTEGSLAVQTSGNGVFRVSLYKIPEKCRWGGHAPIFALLLQWKQINKLTKRFNR